MNFIQKITEAGFIEQGQKKLLDMMPHKEKWIPKWWESYTYDKDWLGLHIDHPDAWFRKEGFDGEVVISLQGMCTGIPNTEEDIILMENRACRYICLTIGNENIYEAFSGKLPSDDVVEIFLQQSYKQTV